jgi:hypothetical protein
MEPFALAGAGHTLTPAEMTMRHAERFVTEATPDGQRRIRLALCGLTALVDDIVSVLLRDADDVDIVAHLGDSADLLGEFQRSGADMLICAVGEREMASRWQAALRERPPVAVLNLGPDATRGCVFALREAQTVLGELTAESFLRTVRGHIDGAGADDDV